jgi:hypothetical protein
MSWSQLVNNQLVSGNNLSGSDLTAKNGQTVPSGNKIITRSEANTRLNIIPITNDNKCVKKIELIATDYNCSTSTRAVTVAFNDNKTTRIYISGTPALFKFTIVTITKLSGNSGTITASLKGGTNSGYNMVYYGLASVGPISGFSPSTYLVAQDVNYIDVNVQFTDLFNINDAVLQIEYKLECPIAIGSRVDLHYAKDTADHACDLNYFWEETVGEDYRYGFIGTRPFFVENGSLTVGNKLFGLPTGLRGAIPGIQNDDFLGPNDRAYTYGDGYPYGNALTAPVNSGPAFYWNFTNDIGVFQASEGYFSDGSTVVQIDTTGTIVSVSSCGVIVMITATVPFQANCNNYFDFYLTASVAVTTSVTGYIDWYGDLGGFFSGTVTLTSGQSFTFQTQYSGGSVSCSGENFSSGALILSPGSGPGQTYISDGVTTAF